VPRKITTELDEVDQKIWDMKQQKISNGDVAATILLDFGIKYDPKTIGTRFLRIKGKMEKKKEKELETSGDLWKDGDVS
jgi:hypothetical protein